MLVILANRVVDPKRIIREKWRAEEKERHMGSLPPQKKNLQYIWMYIVDKVL
jgi:hypothetical protein